jgi:DNA-binding NarL/FixJ family response regulator
MNKIIKVAVVEDHEQFRSKLVELVTEAANLKLTGAYQDALAAIKAIPLAKPDLVVMDIRLPGKDGVECMRELKQSFPEMDFLMLTSYEDSDLVFESLKAGAGGYLLKRTSSTKLLDAIRELNSGGSPMTPHIARRVVEYFSKTQTNSRPDPAPLTPGQINFLEELSRGYSYKEIADHLGITVHGVRNYIRKIYDKLHVHSKVEAVNKYLGR